MERALATPYLMLLCIASEGGVNLAIQEFRRVLNIDNHPQLRRTIRVVTYTAAHAIIVIVQVFFLMLIHKAMILMSVDSLKFFGLLSLSDVIDAMELIVLATFLIASTIEAYKIFNEGKQGDQNEP